MHREAHNVEVAPEGRKVGGKRKYRQNSRGSNLGESIFSDEELASPPRMGMRCPACT